MIAPGRFRLWLLLIVAAQIVFLCWIPATRMLLLATGEPALLLSDWHTTHWLNRGEYVYLDYDVSKLELAQIATDVTDFDELSRHQQVFVVWERDGRYHRAVGLYRDRPFVRSDQLAVRARFSWHSRDHAFVEYGIERFYVPANTKTPAGRIETIKVEVRVGSRGNLIISRIFVNGRELELTAKPQPWL